MKIANFFICMVVGIMVSNAQVPDITYSDFDFKKQPTKVEEVFYKFEDKAAEPTSIQVWLLNEDGFIVRHYMQIIGEYESQTNTDFIYDNGKLIKKVVTASAANFNSENEYQYDASGIITSETITFQGKTTKANYTYNKDGTLASIMIPVTDREASRNFSYTYENGKLVREDYKFKMQNEGGYSYSKVFRNDSLFAEWNNELSGEVTYHLNNEILKKNLDIIGPSKGGEEQKDVIQSLEILNTNAKTVSAFARDLKESELVTIVTQEWDATNEQGDWIKRYRYNNSFGTPQKRLGFRKYTYVDATTSGSTEFDFFYAKRMGFE